MSLFVCVCVSAHTQARMFHMSAGEERGWKKASDPLELVLRAIIKLWATMSQLETKPRSSARTAGAPNHWMMPLAQLYSFKWVEVELTRHTIVHQDVHRDFVYYACLLSFLNECAPIARVSLFAKCLLVVEMRSVYMMSYVHVGKAPPLKLINGKKTD